MYLHQLAAALGRPCDAEDLKISGLTADSREVQPGFLFAALKGVHVDGSRFADRAVEKGAVAILCDEESALELREKLPAHVALLVHEEPRLALALMAARFYPDQPDVMVAVTGTSGKTSVAYFVRQIFEAAGHLAASLGTLGTVTAKGAEYGGLTTPDPVSLHRELGRLAGQKITHAALEASSHGLDQYRLDGVRLTAGAFTNLGRDHMDYHPTVEDYLSAKLRLFRELLPSQASVVVDPDEAYADRVMKVAEERGLSSITVGENGSAFRLLNIQPTGSGQILSLQTRSGEREVMLPLIGRFQVSNALLAAGLALAAGLDTEVILHALEKLKGAPGRLEFAGKSKSGGTVVIDYAHKPDALENALSALRPYASGKLGVVIGAGGDRDPGKRILMGEAAASCADFVIVTDDNPRTEDPAEIRKAVLEGAPEALEIADRAAAIREGVSRLEAGDILCVAGKGHETGQIVGSSVLPFSDHEAVAQALAEQSGISEDVS